MSLNAKVHEKKEWKPNRTVYIEKPPPPKKKTTFKLMKQIQHEAYIVWN